jgi:PAS domain S-box-containing protein
MKVTATQETERVLRQAREDFRTRVESVPAIIYTDAPDFEDDGVYVNPHIQEVLGITQRDFLETDAWIDMMHPEDRDRVVREYTEYRNGGADVADYRVVRPDGEVVWIRDRATLVRDTASGLMFEHGILFDVTELKQAEEVITRQVELLKKIDLIGRDFTALVLRGEDLRRILENLARITGNPVVLEDAAHRPIGSAGSENVIESLLDDWARHSRDGHSATDPGLTREGGEGGCVWIPITLRDEPWGRLHLVEGGRAIDDVDALALDRAAAAVSLSLLYDRDSAGLAEQAGSSLVLDVFNGRTASAGDMLRRTRGLGIHMEGLRLELLL